jgi:hypothetical protein
VERSSSGKKIVFVQPDGRRQRAEAQRHADYLARLTQEQEERENKEARERFAESQRKRWGGKPE